MFSSVFFFFSSRRRHTRFDCDWSSDVCSSDLRHREAGELVRSKRKILPSVNRDLIVELDLLRTERPAESDQSLAQPSLCLDGAGRRLSESDAMQERAEILERAVEPDAAGSHVLRDRH